MAKPCDFPALRVVLNEIGSFITWGVWLTDCGLAAVDVQMVAGSVAMARWVDKQ